jgi:C4-dicarboxylate-specific signal transduction histidine kinase
VQERGEVTFEEATGRPARMIGTVHDVTEQRAVEEEMQQLRAELAHLDRVATVGGLTSAIAHEINQPLAAVLSNAQAALRFLDGDGADLEEVRQALRDIVEDAKRAGEVIRRTRAMLRKEASEPSVFDLNGVIVEVIEVLGSEVILRNIRCERRLHEGRLLVRADRVQIQQVVVNVIRNALDAMAGVPEAERRLFVSTRAGDGGDAVVAVRDAGPPLAEGDVERMFEPFYTTKESGLGMGLVISRSLVSAHGGRLWAERNPDRGLTVQLALPRVFEEFAR